MVFIPNLFFKCTMRKNLEIITTECNHSSSMCINITVVTAIVNTGQRYNARCEGNKIIVELFTDKT
jgi:hypothetical protein